MNDEKQKQQKVEKWGRQISYTALKLIKLSGRAMAQIKGNGLIITIKRWEDAVNEYAYVKDNGKNETAEKENGDKRQVEQGKGAKEHEEETLKKETEEEILDDKSFKEQIAKIRKGWKK